MTAGEDAGDRERRRAYAGAAARDHAQVDQVRAHDPVATAAGKRKKSVIESVTERGAQASR